VKLTIAFGYTVTDAARQTAILDDRVTTRLCTIGSKFSVGARPNLISPVDSYYNAFRPITPVHIPTANSASSSVASSGASRNGPQAHPGYLGAADRTGTGPASAPAGP
jgi:hypothetical protein